MSEYSRAYYRKNRKKMLASQKKWRAANKEGSRNATELGSEQHQQVQG